MGRYKGKTDREYSQDRIAQAQKKHENKLKNKMGLYPKSDILALPFDPSKYGSRIRNIRKERGLTIPSLATEIGTSAATLSKMENGTIKNLNIDFLYLLCAVFNTSPHYLFGLVSDPNIIPQVGEAGNIEELTSPIRPTEPTPALLSNALVDLNGIPGVVNETYLKDPGLCAALLFTLQHRNADIQRRLKDAIYGICAICLPESEWRELKSGDN